MISIQICQTPSSFPKFHPLSQNSNALSLWDFSFYDFKLGKEMRCMGLTKIILNARDLLPKLRILNICQFGNENWGSCTSFRINSTRFQSSATHFHPSKNFKYSIFTLICTHMAQYSLFSGACKMCLMGDIQVHSKYR